MKKLVLPLLLLLVLAAPGQALLLRYKSPVGQVQKYHMQCAMRVAVTSESMPSPLRMELAIDSDITYRTLAHPKPDQFLLQVTDSSRVTMGMPGGKQQTTTNKTTSKITFDSLGAVVSKDEQPAADPFLRDLDRAFESMMLPKREVKPGDTWEYEREGVKVSGKFLSLAKQDKLQCAKLSYVVTFTTEAEGQRQQVVARFIQYFAYAQGKDVLQEGTVEIAGAMTVPLPNGASSEIKQNIKANFRVRLRQ